MRTTTQIDVAIAFAVCDGELLLIQRRDTNPALDRKWEFPGGKIEAGEEAADALARELREETGLDPQDVAFAGIHAHDWNFPDRTLRVRLHCFRCRVSSKDVRLEERTAYGHAWVAPENVHSYDLLEANAELARTLL